MEEEIIFLLLAEDASKYHVAVVDEIWKFT